MIPFATFSFAAHLARNTSAFPHIVTPNPPVQQWNAIYGDLGRQTVVEGIPTMFN
jgi:hypothetical protein